MVVAWFGSQGVFAYDVNGTLLWKVDLGHVDMGANAFLGARMGSRQLSDYLERTRPPAVRYAGRFICACPGRSDRKGCVEDRFAGSCRRGEHRQ